MSPRRIVTVPPLHGASALSFAQTAKAAGAELLEVRTDLCATEAVDVPALAKVLPLVASQRGKKLPRAWVEAATFTDLPLEEPLDECARGAGKVLLSHHAEKPLSSDEAVARWAHPAAGSAKQLKHIEPMFEGDSSLLTRLFETRRRLQALHPSAQVTVLAMGPYALPFRCVLARENALDYAALSQEWLAAPGQRLLGDAVREIRAAGKDPKVSSRARLGILGTRINASRSPRVHPQPFDRLDLPEDAPLELLLPALLPHYRGFAVTSPFKRCAARAVGADVEAVNTLYRHKDRFLWGNTDVAGARALLSSMDEKVLTVLGDGGSTFALKEASRTLSVELVVRTRAELVASREPLHGAAVWTWPDGIAPPEGMRLDGLRVALLAYGAPARRIAQRVIDLGGTPLRFGARWFVAQAREQRRLWEKAS